MAGSHRPEGSPRARRRSGGLAVLLPLALFAISLFIALIAYVGTIRVYDRAISDLPDPRDLDSIVLGENSGVFDRTGTVKLADFGTDLRETIGFSEIPSIVIDTTTVIEDKTFWQNSGFDPLGFIAAALDTLGGSGRGGSTITQQLVRGILLPDTAFHVFIICPFSTHFNELPSKNNIVLTELLSFLVSCSVNTLLTNLTKSFSVILITFFILL